jgi:hypothetical protein
LGCCCCSITFGIPGDTAEVTFGVTATSITPSFQTMGSSPELLGPSAVAVGGD